MSATMKSVLPIYLFEPFTPEMIATMQAAFDEACVLVGCKDDDEAGRQLDFISSRAPSVAFVRSRSCGTRR
jgi:hypothetical protein